MGRHRTDQVAAPVAVAVDRQAQVGGRHELRLADGAGPRTSQLVGRQIAAIDDLERRDELTAEVVLAPRPRAHQGGQSLGERPPSGELPVVGLHAPDRRDRVAVDAVACFRGRQGGRVTGHHLPAVVDALLVHQERHVVPDRRLELGLRLHRLDDLGIGRDARHHAIEGRAGHAFLDRALADARDARVEVGGVRRDCRHDERGDRQRPSSADRAIATRGHGLRDRAALAASGARRSASPAR
jgi:hypothetical protein